MGDKLQFFGLLTIIIAILAGISLTWVLPQKQLAFAPTGDGGGGSGDGGNGGGGDGSGGGDGGGGSGGGPRGGGGNGDGHHHHHHSSHHQSHRTINNNYFITNNYPTPQPTSAPELTNSTSPVPEGLNSTSTTVPDPLCTKNPHDILCQVDCTTNPNDPSCKPASPPPTLAPEPAPELTNGTSTTVPQEFSFKETLEVSPDLKGAVMTGPTNKFVDSSGAMHIVGELRNDASKTLHVYQIVATIYGLNNQTLGLDTTTPTPDTLSPGQSASFEFFVGGDQPSDGVSDLSQISRVKYHVGF